jgi:hypothetical protein
VSALRPCNPYRRSCCNSPGRREADCFRKAPRDLWPMLGQLVGDFQRHTDSARRLRLTRFPSATLWSRIDLDAFAILMRNLVENALAPGDADKEVVIAAEDTGSDRVANRGTIVSSQEIAKLRAIVSGADGRLDLISPCGAHVWVRSHRAFTEPLRHRETLAPPAGHPRPFGGELGRERSGSAVINDWKEACGVLVVCSGPSGPDHLRSAPLWC